MCDWCGAATGVSGFTGWMPDSSCVHRSCPELDGQRYVVACSVEHLRGLRDYYTHRPFHLEQLWAAQLDRAVEQARTEGRQPTLDELGRQAGLSSAQLGDALRWQQTHRPDAERADG